MQRRWHRQGRQRASRQHCSGAVVLVGAFEHRLAIRLRTLPRCSGRVKFRPSSRTVGSSIVKRAASVSWLTSYPVPVRRYRARPICQFECWLARGTMVRIQSPPAVSLRTQNSWSGTTGGVAQARMRWISRRTLASSSFSSRRCLTRSPMLTMPFSSLSSITAEQARRPLPRSGDCEQHWRLVTGR
jgi:hypothetical protein